MQPIAHIQGGGGGDLIARNDVVLYDTSRDRGVAAYSSVRTMGPFGEPTVTTRSSDTTVSATNGGVRSTDLTDRVEVVATRATVRTLAGE